ncbi:hypothetical protein JCM8097_002361 [Rhodosporidiobolus ruineniae]
MRPLSRAPLARVLRFASSPLASPPRLFLTFSTASRLRRLSSPVDTAYSVLSSASVRPLQTTAVRKSQETSNGQLKPFVLADIGEGITECEIVKWLVKPGDKVEEFDPLVEVMSDKASVEITSPFSGTVESLAGGVGDMLKVGSTLCDIRVVGEAGEPAAEPAASSEPDLAAPSPPPSPAQVVPPPPPAASSSASRSDILATPATRRIAHELGIDLSRVKGTGKDGRTTREDVLAASNGAATPSTPSSPTAAIPTSSTGSSPASSTSIPLSSTRRAMFRAMTASLSIPHFAYSEFLDVTELERLRVKLSAQIPLKYRKTLSAAEEAALARQAYWTGEVGVPRVEEGKRIERVTLLPLLLKALSLAMAEHPLFLCSLSPPPSSSSSSGDEPTLVRRTSHDLAIALSSPSPSGGLYTPVLRSVERSSVFDLASQIAFLQSLLSPSSPSSSSAAPKFPPEHQGTPTLTLSNVGVVGGRTTHPVVPPTGQLAIGAVGRVRVEPRFAKGREEGRARRVATGLEEEGEAEWKVEPRLVLDATFSADHRVVEGVELARLVETWKRIVEEPSRLLA